VTPYFHFLVMTLLAQSDAVAKQKAAVESQIASLDAQRASVRRQARLAPAQTSSFFVILDNVSGAAQDCEPLSLLRRRNLIDTAARRAGIRPDLLEAVMEQESAFRPCSISSKGAIGLMQLMPATSTKLGLTDPYNPDQNVAGGAMLLKELFDRYSGDLNRVLGAYNAGTVRVDEAGGVPAIPETTNYVDRIMKRLLEKN
jgi:soluble lytic murein transglycosylase-like protein